MQNREAIEKTWEELPGDHPQWYLDAYPLMYLPDSQTSQGTVTPAAFSGEIGFGTRQRHTNIYVHVPFCKKPCDYCVLHKTVYKEKTGSVFVQALKAEIDLWAASDLTADIECGWVVFGGGTPTTLSAACLVELYKTFASRFPCRDDFQCSMEASTATCDQCYFDTLLEGGIGRISFGIQSFDTQSRKYLGCLDSGGQARQTVMDAAASGFSNINIDMLYGLPGQTLSDLEKDLQKALDLNLPCYTLYPLAVYPSSRLYRRMQTGTVPPAPQPPLTYAMFDLIADRMKKAGYIRSWLNQYVRTVDDYPPNSSGPKNYLSFGSGAFGTLHNWSYLNDLDLPGYLEAVSQGVLPFSHRAPISLTHQTLRKFFKAFIFRMRLQWNDFTNEERSALEFFLQPYAQLGLWIEDDQELVPTPAGLHVADQLVQALLLDSIPSSQPSGASCYP